MYLYIIIYIYIFYILYIYIYIFSVPIFLSIYIYGDTYIYILSNLPSWKTNFYLFGSWTIVMAHNPSSSENRNNWNGKTLAEEILSLSWCQNISETPGPPSYTPINGNFSQDLYEHPHFVSCPLFLWFTMKSLSLFRFPPFVAFFLVKKHTGEAGTQLWGHLLRGGSAAAGGPHLWEGCVYHPWAGLQLLEHDDNKKPILQALWWFFNSPATMHPFVTRPPGRTAPADRLKESPLGCVGRSSRYFPVFRTAAAGWLFSARFPLSDLSFWPPHWTRAHTLHQHRLHSRREQRNHPPASSQRLRASSVTQTIGLNLFSNQVFPSVCGE